MSIGRNIGVSIDPNRTFDFKERDNLSAQLENIENKAMKSFSMSVENDIVAIDADEAGEAEVNSDVIKQMNKLMKKNGKLKIY